MSAVEQAGLFPASGTATPQDLGDEAPVASGSRSPSPKRSASPAKEEDASDDGDLFGDDDEDDKPASLRDRAQSSSATPASSRSENAEASQRDSPHPLEYPEEEGEDDGVGEVWANIAMPKMPRLRATDGKIWHLRLPAYVNIEPKPYDPNYYRETLTDAEIDGSKDHLAAKSRMLGIKNTIRWRWETGPDGTPVRRSNARMLRWSDGSMSLQLGSNLFDVAASYGTTLARPSDLPDQKPELQLTSKTGSTFLCVAVGSERVLLTEGPIAGQLSLVPTSMTSATHLELAKHVGQQHVKHSRMKILDDSVEADTLAKMQREAAGKAVVAKSRAKREPGMGGSRRNKSRRAKSEDSGSDRGYRREKNYDEDDGFVVADDDEEEAEETEGEDDAAWGSKRSKSKKAKKAKKRKGSDSLDELELADRRLEARDRERKRAKKDKAKSRDYVDSDEDEEEAEAEVEAGEEDADVDMDVESEDE